jgi:hypothetical protein
VPPVFADSDSSMTTIMQCMLKSRLFGCSVVRFPCFLFIFVVFYISVYSPESTLRQRRFQPDSALSTSSASISNVIEQPEMGNRIPITIRLILFSSQHRIEWCLLTTMFSFSECVASLRKKALLLSPIRTTLKPIWRLLKIH